MAENTGNSGIAARSLTCDTCSARFTGSDAAQIHAEKTEHQSFSESTEELKPLTEAEKKAKLQQLREKLALKRKGQADEEIENMKKNGLIERKKNQESAEIIEKLQRQEELKIVAARKKEKEEDMKAKQRVRNLLEQDKKDRLAQSLREKAARNGEIPQPVDAPVAACAPTRTSDHSSARLQIRSKLNKPIVRTWPRDTTMLQVAEDIASETNVDPHKAVFKMFGRVINGELLAKTLGDLGLTPNASLQLS